MIHKPDWMRKRAAIRILVPDLMENRDQMKRGHEVGDYDHYRDWLLARGGNPMRRAMIKAEARYERLKPACIRAARLHQAYRGKRR